jgi:small subunit ribosomal protein S16
MPVKIRLTRMGKKKQPTYRVVVVDSRKPRDGAHIEQIGRYDPRQEPSIVEIDNDRALAWLQDGAQPTDRARKLLEISGAWSRFRVARGDIHTIDDRAPAEEAADTSPSPEAPDEAVTDIPESSEDAGEAPAELSAAESKEPLPAADDGATGDTDEEAPE